MIRKEDCLLLLTEIQSTKGKETDPYINMLLSSSDIPVEVIKYININRPIDVASFYEKLRKSYNAKKSKLYINLVKENFEKPEDVLTTLASLSLQILLFNNKLTDGRLFLKESRFEEITRVLNNYSKTYDLRPCLKVLYLIKCDLKLFEGINF